MMPPTMPTIDEFVVVLSKHFENTIRSGPADLGVAGLTTLTPDQVIETYNASVKAALAWANGVAP